MKFNLTNESEGRPQSIAGIRFALAFVVLLCGALPTCAQQSGQWVPGQFGLNAGVIPDPGITYQNLALNYSAGTLNDSNGNARPGITGTYQFWVDENIFMYVPKFKFLGAYLAPYVSLNVANGSLVADIAGTNLGLKAGGDGLADTYVQPVNLGWHFSRANVSIGYGFFTPNGRFTAGATNNIGSGYWGNHINQANTFYLTKNKGTTASFFSDWEGHAKKAGTNVTPGQAYTMEWGIGQALPLAKDMSKIVQVGFVGYDQWQITDTRGALVPGLVPYYSSHALGVQANFIAPNKGLLFFFKYYNEQNAKARPEGRTFVFGGAWTIKIPKS
jgi:hypothetical protein